MYGTLVVNSWVGIHEGCDITYTINGCDGVYITVHGQSHPFEFFFESGALRQFIAQGDKAMAEMDAIAAQEGHEQDAAARARLDLAEERSV